MQTSIKPVTMFAMMLLFGFIATSNAWACAFCPPYFKNTLLQELDAVPAAVLAKLSHPAKEDAEGLVTTGYRVVTVLRGGERIKTGDKINLPLAIPSPLGSVHLLLAVPDRTSQWQKPRGLSPAAQQFIRQGALLPTVNDEEADRENRIRRLIFVLPHLVSDDVDIARAAYGEFAAAPYATVKALKPVLNPFKIRAWIELNQGVATDRRLLFTLLAACGRPADAEFVKAELDERVAADEMTELDGIIAAYLTLAGPKGLDKIDRQLMEPNEISPAVRRAASRALRFHVEEGNVFDRKRVIASCRLLLDDPKAADYAIRDLARWEDWESLDAVLKLQREYAKTCRWLKQPIKEYLQACPLPAANEALAATSGEKSGGAAKP